MSFVIIKANLIACPYPTGLFLVAFDTLTAFHSAVIEGIDAYLSPEFRGKVQSLADFCPVYEELREGAPFESCWELLEEPCRTISWHNLFALRQLLEPEPFFIEGEPVISGIPRLTLQAKWKATLEKEANYAWFMQVHQITNENELECDMKDQGQIYLGRLLFFLYPVTDQYEPDFCGEGLLYSTLETVSAFSLEDAIQTFKCRGRCESQLTGTPNYLEDGRDAKVAFLSLLSICELNHPISSGMLLASDNTKYKGHTSLTYIRHQFDELKEINENRKGSYDPVNDSPYQVFK